MGKADSGRMITHIDEAKDWLDKAKEEYVQSNSLRGDLHLNLAQAEVKYAWELSRGQNVEKIESRHQRHNRNFLIPAAALIIVTLFGAVISISVLKGFKVGKDTVAGHSVRDRVMVGKEQKTACKVEPAPLMNAFPKNVTGNPKIEAPIEKEEKKSYVIPKTVGAGQTKGHDTQVEKRLPIVAESNTQVEKEKTVFSNNTGDERSRENINPVKAQPVSNIIIDEEALTREASNNLRFGK